MIMYITTFSTRSAKIYLACINLRNSRFILAQNLLSLFTRHTLLIDYADKIGFSRPGYIVGLSLPWPFHQ